MDPSHLTEDQAGVMVIMGACCCFIAVVGFIGLFIWLVRRGAKDSLRQSFQQPANVPAAAPAPVAAPAGQHLSVLAVAFDGFFRDQVQAVLTAPWTATDAFAQRVELVQRVSRALLGVEPQWRAFGYGEKDLGDITATQESYLRAVEDFRARSAGPGDGGRLVVLTLIIATRTHLVGVDRLDQRAQVRAVLEDRARLAPTNLLGADVLWSPLDGGLSEPALLQRFPEMHALVA
jgi:hypothetical protein